MHMHHELPCACTALNKATRAMTRLYDDALATSGMTVQQFAILRHVARARTIETSRLAELLSLDRTSLYRALAPLERSCWVSRAASGRGRTRIVTLTDAGIQAMAAAVPAWQATQERVIGAFGDARFTEMLSALADLPAGARR